MKGPAFQTELATAYPECRLVVTKETLTVEGMIKAWEIHTVFPPFYNFRMRQNLWPNALAKLCGAALKLSTTC